MESRLVTLDESLDFTASSTKSLAIPRNRFIQSIKIVMKITGDTAGTVVVNEDYAAALASKVRLVANGSDHLVNLKMADLWRLNKYRYSAAPKNDLISTVSQSGVLLGTCVVTLDFRMDPKNPLDMRALLPAHMFSNLSLFVDWGASASLGTGYTVTSVSTKVMLKEFTLDAAEINALGSLARITETAIEGDALSAAHSDYTYKTDTIPVGKIIRSIGVVAIDNSIRDADIITAFKLHDGRSSKDVMTQDFDHSQAQDAEEYQLGDSALETGFTIIDLEGLGFLDTVSAKVGDIALKCKTGSPTSTAGVRLLITEVE